MNAGTVMICGKEYPLCMTVEAFGQITQACGGLDKLGNYLDGNGDINKMISNTAFVLAILWPAFMQMEVRKHARCLPNRSCVAC